MYPALGSDIGAAQIKGAVADHAGNPTAVSNQENELQTPACVHIAADGSIAVGRTAVERGCLDPDGFASNIKPKLNTADNLLRNGRAATAVDLTAALVSALKEDAERLVNAQIDCCVTGCPAISDDPWKANLIKAHERAGLEVLRTVPEPVAAGYPFGVLRANRKSLLMVYDIGHYSSDASILLAESGQVRVLATEGLKRGGNDLDQIIETRVLDYVEAECGSRPSPTQDSLFFLDLRQRIEHAKISLGRQPEVPITVSWQGRCLVITLNQVDFQRDAEFLLQEIKALSDQVIAQAGLQYSDLDDFLAVGGTLRPPFLRDSIAGHVGLAPRTEVDPAKAVAYGLAMLCVEELQRLGRHSWLGGRIIPTPNVLLRDVTIHAVGCAVLDRDSGELLNAVIVPRNSSIPGQYAAEFFLEHEDQMHASIEMLQGKADAKRDECTSLGVANFENLPTERRRTRRIRVECLIDQNAMVTTTVTDKVSGQTQSIGFSFKHGVAGVVQSAPVRAAPSTVSRASAVALPVSALPMARTGV